MGKVVSFINMKGGVGKTTLCIGIGEYLANNHSKKVLFIDLDPQFNTTQSLMNAYNKEDTYLDEYVNNNKTVQKIFEMPTTISKKPEMPKKQDVIVELDDNIHIVPGTIDLIFEDNNSSGKAKRIDKFIKKNNLKDEYQYIFIDCPPTISLYTDAALYASDYYLVPNRIDRYSMLGIKLLDKAIEKLRFDDEESIHIKLLGIVYTMFDSGAKSNDIQDKFENSGIIDKNFIFKNRTSFVKDLLVGKRGNISSNYKKSNEDISKVCDEFLERIDEYDKQ